MSQSFELVHDVWWIFVFPSILLISTCTNAICLRVLLSMRRNNFHRAIYIQMIAKSASVMIYSFICSFVFLIKCGSRCAHISDTYAVKIYQAYFYYIIAGILGMFSNLTELWMIVERFIILVSNLDKSVTRLSRSTKNHFTNNLITVVP